MKPTAFEERTYHVHRTVLAIGERRSAYFANLLHYGIDDGNRCSSIELSSRAVEYFPDLLDFMYSSKAFAITTRNAIPLLFLSRCLQVAALEARVKVFIDEDIKLNNFGYYMSGALYFGDEISAVKVITTCEKEAISWMNDTNIMSVEFGLGNILKFPLLPKAEKCCHSIWSFLTHKQSGFQIKKNVIRNLVVEKLAKGS